jgi:hypothetical protein
MVFATAAARISGLQARAMVSSYATVSLLASRHNTRIRNTNNELTRNNMGKPKTTHLVCTWGIRRSGNRVIASWAANQYAPPVHNPINPSLDYLLDCHRNNRPVNGHHKWGEVMTARVLPFEEHSIDSVAIPGDNRMLFRAIGESKELHRLVILRDPYNLFATRTKHYELLSSSGKWIDRRTATFRWLEYAKAFTGETTLPGGTICVPYNRFITDLAYRKRLSEQLGGKFNDGSLDIVDDNGGGSSFDGTEYSGNARAMPVTERWKMYADNEAFRSLFTDEIRDYSKKIFDFAPF